MGAFFFAAIVFFFTLQFGAPLLAAKIRARFQDLGYVMNSRPAFAMLRFSGFWSEAGRLNKTARDRVVRQLLLVYYAWWALVIATSILWFVVA